MKTITQFTSIESFATERLYAEKVTASDLDKFTLMHNDPRVMATLGGIRDAVKTQENLNWNLQHWTNHGYGLWMFYLKDTKQWVGRGGVRRVTVGDKEETEVGYALLPAFWNQGLATEIANACVEIAFAVLRLDQIVSFTLDSNLPSQHVMEKIGFKYERDLTHAGLPHVLYRMHNPRKVAVVPHDAAWKDIYAREAQKIQSTLGPHLKEIYHFGSTAIPNMPAKPIIDILLVCENLDEIATISERLHQLNYYNIRRHVVPHRSFFTRRQDANIGFNLHIRERGDPQINRHINFRDYLISHPEMAGEYAELKLALARQYQSNINAYVFGKDKLVQKIDALAKVWPERKKDYLAPNTGPVSTAWPQEKLVKAMEANLNVHMTHFSQYLNQIELIRIPGYTIVNSGLPDDTFNYVIEADFSKAEAPSKILDVTNYFLNQNVPFSWWLSPYDQPEELPLFLSASGYTNTENNIAMYFDLDAWDGNIIPIPGLEIVQAKDKKSLLDFALILANDENCFNEYFSWIAAIYTEDDPIEFYVGYVNGKPVVRGLSCYFGQVAGLHWLSTHPTERHKGYDKAMQEFRLQRAKSLGYHISVLQASSGGYPLYKQLGYKEVGIFKEFKLQYMSK